ncbi:hypothetical protein PLESTB_001821500 [Pleodorina starrii]|uniref:HVA22-like protein n=1 Tax=Pleodorina starrii TaxID=330485 RepID=A0A9W6C1B9_9CHLO|nr:hypothetical protein PLESTB_001821500 [Pleodorina starrii]
MAWGLYQPGHPGHLCPHPCCSHPRCRTGAGARNPWIESSSGAYRWRRHLPRREWLTYWTLYGSLILAEHLADQALGKVPYYYHAKFAALLWLQLPQTQGAAYLYKRYYKPALAKYGTRIDSVLVKLKSVLATLYSTYKVPIDATVALLLELQKQAAAALKWLLSDDTLNKGPKDGAKARAA